jgi:hypothetical protein
MKEIKYNDSISIAEIEEEDGVCKVIISTTVYGGAGGPLYLKDSFDLADLLQTIIEKDPELFRKKVWKPLADKYGYPLKALTEGEKQDEMSSKSKYSNYLYPPPPPSIYKEITK